MLIDNAKDFVDPLTELSVNTKIYTAKALNRELVTPEFIQAAKSISVSDKIEVIAQSSAVKSAGATIEQSKALATARATTMSARKEWNEAMASGDKAAQQAAENAFMAAREAETVAGAAVIEAVGAASAAATAAQSATTAAQSITSEVAEAAEAASAAAQEVSTQVAEVSKNAADAAREAQQATLDALWAAEATANNTFDVFRATAAIRQVQAEMNGNEFSYRGASSFEEAMKKIDEGQASGKNAVEWSNENDGDPNRMGPCGKPSC
jgi:hypothetical protein